MLTWTRGRRGDLCECQGGLHKRDKYTWMMFLGRWRSSLLSQERHGRPRPHNRLRHSIHRLHPDRLSATLVEHLCARHGRHQHFIAWGAPKCFDSGEEFFGVQAPFNFLHPTRSPKSKFSTNHKGLKSEIPGLFALPLLLILPKFRKAMTSFASPLRTGVIPTRPCFKITPLIH